jgi:hypothetical protein
MAKMRSSHVSTDLRSKLLEFQIQMGSQYPVLESQDPEVEQHSSSTAGPTTKGPAMTEPTDKTRQARLAETEPTDTTKQARVSRHDPTKLARLLLLDPSDDDHTSSS